MPARPASASPGLPPVTPLHSVVQPCSWTWIGGLFPASEPLHLQFPPPRDPLLKVLCYQVTSSSFRVTFPDHFFDKNWMWSGIILFICFLFIVCLASLNHKLLRAGPCSQPKPQYLERGRHTVVLGLWGWCLLRECDISFAHLHWYSFCILTPQSLRFPHMIHCLELYFTAAMKGKKSMDCMREKGLPSSKGAVPTRWVTRFGTGQGRKCGVIILDLCLQKHLLIPIPEGIGNT